MYITFTYENIAISKLINKMLVNTMYTARTSGTNAFDSGHRGNVPLL